MNKIQGKEIKGFSYADGVHWYWGDTEVAVINEFRREIEWCDRVSSFPDEVVSAIRNKLPKPHGVWVIEARRTQQSETQGTISIFVNNQDMNMHFEDKMELKDGKYVSTTPDDELGSFIYACFWHKLDAIMHYSERFKDLFYPSWRKTSCEQTGESVSKGACLPGIKKTETEVNHDNDDNDNMAECPYTDDDDIYGYQCEHCYMGMCTRPSYRPCPLELETLHGGKK